MNLVTAKTFYESPTAWIALNQLESEGIKAFMENEMLVQNAWELGEAAGQIRLKVAESDFEKACEILQGGSGEISQETAPGVRISRASLGSDADFFSIPISADELSSFKQLADER